MSENGFIPFLGHTSDVIRYNMNRVMIKGKSGYLSLSLSPCTSVPLPLYLCTSLPLYLCTSLPLYLSPSVPLYLSPSVPLYLSPSVPLYLCTSLPLYLSPCLSHSLSILPILLYLSLSPHPLHTLLNLSLSRYLSTFLCLSVSTCFSTHCLSPFTYLLFLNRER